MVTSVQYLNSAMLQRVTGNIMGPKQGNGSHLYPWTNESYRTPDRQYRVSKQHWDRLPPIYFRTNSPSEIHSRDRKMSGNKWCCYTRFKAFLSMFIRSRIRHTSSNHDIATIFKQVRPLIYSTQIGLHVNYLRVPFITTRRLIYSP